MRRNIHIIWQIAVSSIDVKDERFRDASSNWEAVFVYVIRRCDVKTVATSASNEAIKRYKRITLSRDPLSDDFLLREALCEK